MKYALLFAAILIILRIFLTTYSPKEKKQDFAIAIIFTFIAYIFHIQGQLP